MQPPARAALLRHPGFLPFLAGAAISGLGDQFTLIALPWLVLRLTGDAQALGAIVALLALPRAALMLFGGAIVDRWSPRRVLMLTKYVNTALLVLLALLVDTGRAGLSTVVALGLAMSVASAFAIPAGTSLMPHVVAAEWLQGANGMMMGVRQLTLLAGPLLAGLLFALAGDAGADNAAGPHPMRGLALAFGLDALSFALSAWTLTRVAVRPAPAGAAQPVLRAMGEALAHAWSDVPLRAGLVYWGLCACVVGGIVQVALPLLAATRLHGALRGAAALGVLGGAHGAGTLAGMVVCAMAARGARGRQPRLGFGATLLALDAAIGLLLPLLGLVTAAWQGVLVNLAIGVLGGYANVAVFTWIQQRVPRAMLGRMMSIFMFVVLGAAPLAAAAAGWLASRVSLPSLFAGAGGFLAGAAVLAWLFTPLGNLRTAPTRAPLGADDRVA